jgi:hypothetical protein
MERWFQSYILHFKIRIVQIINMILVLFLWLLLLFSLSIFGASVARILYMIPSLREEKYHLSLDEYFFIGFLTLSIITGALSIFIPIGDRVLAVFCIAVFVLLAINIRQLKTIFRRSIKALLLLKNWERILLAFFVIFVLMAVVQDITWLDTQAYHAQNIQWIRKYPVVPGLGNLHDRFAFNSMFFVLSGLFTFHLRDIIVFPLNGICYVVLITKLFILFRREADNGIIWKSVLYILLLLISLFIMLPNINTPSPDIICATLTIYLFVLIFDNSENKFSVSNLQYILINLLIFSCVSFKLSSLFIIMSLLFFIKIDFVKRSLISLVIFALIFSSFLIRNYYLSGYLIYPFPSIDIFSVDWKIPMANVIETKSVIEGWARIPVTPYQEVLAMKFPAWVLPWFSQLSLNSKLLVISNFFSFFLFIVMLIKKDYFLAKIMVILMINLIFWFLEAPDPRFAYGIIFIGFSLTFSYIVKIFASNVFFGSYKYLRVVVSCLLLIIISKRIILPVGTLRDPALWMFPAQFRTVETKACYSNFEYSIPLNNEECYDSEIPCVTYSLDNVIIRGNDLSDGFKVKLENK